MGVCIGKKISKICIVSIVIQLDLVSVIVLSQRIFCKEKCAFFFSSHMNDKLVQVLN